MSEMKVTISTKKRCACDNCGENASKLFWYTYINGRKNPASSMYDRDDCSYCRDSEAFACDDCEKEVKRVCCPDGMEWGATVTYTESNKHYFLRWVDRQATPEEIAAIAQLKETV